MAKRFVPVTQLIKLRRRLQRSRLAGFTLIELLVAIIIASLITVLLMGLVIDLAEANQRDASRSQLQQDMQTAIDYIVQDLREAVFVYNGQCLSASGDTAASGSTCPGIVNYIPAALSDSGKTPVLAFWRTEPLPSGVAAFCGDQTNVRGLASGDANSPINQANLAGVCLASRTYALVVYSIDTTDSNIWDGQARLTRYKLSRFPDDATASNLQQTPGYVDPLEEPSFTFQQWPLDAGGNNRQTANGGRPALAGGQAPVLLDFVSQQYLNQETSQPIEPACRDFVDPAANPPQVLAKQITPISTGATGNPPRSFYACVRGGGLEATAGQNQDVLLSLVGNLTGKPGYARGGPQVSPIQTRVLVRGVIAK